MSGADHRPPIILTRLQQRMLAELMAQFNRAYSAATQHIAIPQGTAAHRELEQLLQNRVPYVQTR